MNSLATCYTIGFDTKIGRHVDLKKQQLNNFLTSVEKRAFKMALITMGNRDDALDVVQEAMMQLVSKYHHKDQEEWPKLFFKILQNKAIDLHRKHKRQKLFSAWLPGKKDEGKVIDPIDNIEASKSFNPDVSNQSKQDIILLESAISRLPLRQQQAFMLRCWEGFSTAETAATMDCSEGSVKTHYSRALQALRLSLGDFYE